MTSAQISLLDTSPFQIEEWRFEPALLRAVSRDDIRQLEPKMMAVLCVLAAKPGVPVTRQEFADEVWAGLIVTDNVLTRAVSELRKLFDDRERPWRVIETVPRVGYRLVAPVEPADGVEESFTGHEYAPPLPRRSRLGLWRKVSVGFLLLIGTLVAGYIFGSGTRGAEGPLPVVPITSEPGFEMTPALSPDGERLAFVHSADEARHLVVSTAEGEDWIRLTRGAARAWAPTWSPDGTRIAFVSYRDGRCTLQTIPALGGDLTRLSECPTVGTTEIDWSPDGRYLAVATVQGPEAIPVYLLDLQTETTDTFVYDWSPGIEDGSPRFSLDGTRLLVVRNESGLAAGLAVIDLGSGRASRVETPAGVVVGHDWLDDERVVVSVLKEQTTLWTTSPESDVPTWLPVTAPGTFRLTASGGHVVAEQWSFRATIERTSLGDLTRREPFAPSTARDYFPAWSPSGRQIAFLSDRSGAIELWIADADGGRARQVSLDGVLLSPPRWSATGRLAFAARADGESEVFVIDSEGVAPRRLEWPGSNETHPNWSPDGRSLYVRSDRGDQENIWRFPVGGGEPTQVTDSGAIVARPSLDGRWLYIVRPGLSGLWRQPLRGAGASTATPKQVYDQTDPSRPHLWAPVLDGVYVAARQPGGAYDLVAIDTVGTQRRLGELSEGALSGFDVAPGGRDIAIGSTGDRSSDLIRITL